MTFRKHQDPRFNAIFRLIDTAEPRRRAFARALAQQPDLLPGHILIVEEDEWDKFLEVLEKGYRQLKEKDKRHRKGAGHRKTKNRGPAQVHRRIHGVGAYPKDTHRERGLEENQGGNQE